MLVSAQVVLGWAWVWVLVFSNKEENFCLHLGVVEWLKRLGLELPAKEQSRCVHFSKHWPSP